MTHPHDTDPITATRATAGQFGHPQDGGLIERKDAEIARLRTDAARYHWLRSRDLDTIHRGGVFAGLTPQNMIINGDDLDEAIDAALRAEQGEVR